MTPSAPDRVLRAAAYEMRTVGAMTLRTAVWIAIGWLAARRMQRSA